MKCSFCSILLSYDTREENICAYTHTTQMKSRLEPCTKMSKHFWAKLICQWTELYVENCGNYTNQKIHIRLLHWETFMTNKTSKKICGYSSTFCNLWSFTRSARLGWDREFYRPMSMSKGDAKTILHVVELFHSKVESQRNKHGKQST